jgi:RecA/RadA recombinase
MTQKKKKNYVMGYKKFLFLKKNPMDVLIEKSEKLIRQVSVSFKRFVYHAIKWEGRLTEIYGPRGAGKTTLIMEIHGKLLPVNS